MPYDKAAYCAVSVIMVVYLLYSFITSLTTGYYNDFTYTELLINLEGGFVRRGLIGQLILYIVQATGWNPFTIIEVFCISIYVSVLTFFLVAFSRRNLNWWILLSPFAFGLCKSIIRKDFLCYAILICTIYQLRRAEIKPIRMIGVTLLSILGLFVHEAYFFWGIPVTLFIIWKSTGSKALTTASTLSLLATFILLSINNGDNETADMIFRSWLPYVNNADFTRTPDNAIGAIGWETMSTFKFHLRENFCNGFLGWSGLYYRPLFALLSYYLIMNCLYILRRNKGSFDEDDRTIFSTIYIFALVCLLPMFILLSCDYGRLYQCALITSLATFSVLPRERIRALIPAVCYDSVSRFNRFLNRIAPPTKGTIIVLLLFIAPSPFSFLPVAAMEKSVSFVDFYLLPRDLIYFVYNLF